MNISGIHKAFNYPAPGGVKDSVQLRAGEAGSAPYIIIPPKDGGLFKSKTSHTQELASFGVKIKEELSVVGGYTAELTDKQVKEMKKRGFTVVLDEQDRFLPPIPFDPSDFDQDPFDVDPKEIKEVKEFKPRPPLAEARFNSNVSQRFTGKGVTIAVIDTGVHPHPDLEGRIIGFVDLVNGRSIPYDDNGHGTHVAGDAAGSGAMSDGLYKGPASEANLVGIKVLNAEGSGKTSDIIKGIQFAIAAKDALNIRVINLSLGHTAQKDWENDPVNQAVQAAHDAGIVVLAAAGNDGPDRKTICAPGDSPFAITIGAADDWNTADRSDDKIADFSSRGPTAGGLQKPDLVAPGVTIMAPIAPMTAKEAMGKQFGMLHETIKHFAEMPYEQLTAMPTEAFVLMGLSPGTVEKIKESPEEAKTQFDRLLNATSRIPLDELGAYQGLPGTSMATPIAAGVVAQMLEANPELTPDQVKEILTSTADPLPDKRLGPNTQGSGLIDPEEALMTALSTPGKRHEKSDSMEDLIAQLMSQGAVLIGGDGKPEEPAKDPENSSKAA